MIYSWCPYCGHESTAIHSRPLKIIKIGNDGYGQPVKYSKCSCGKLHGWLYLSFYQEQEGYEFDEGFRSYLRTRIAHYVSENGSIR